MKKLTRLSSPLFLIVVITFILLILINPESCSKGAADGIVICGKIIIPSLFPFTVFVLFIVKSGLLGRLSFMDKFTEFVFQLTAEQFVIMLLSCIGGYPIGAKLLSEARSQDRISVKNCVIMLNYCVNAGPAFIVIAIGYGVIGSKSIGYILLFAHIVSSLIIAFVSRFFADKSKKINVEYTRLPPSDNFVLSTSQAAETVFGICSCVILFSAVNNVILNLFPGNETVKKLTAFLEITNGIAMQKNILFISFLLGFAGVSIWLQVFSVSRNIPKNIPAFILFRIIHGLISAIITAISLKILGVSVSTFSNNGAVLFKPTYTTITLSLSMLITAIIFIISVSFKKCSGKIVEDLV